jgi:DNA polymerase-3 subunit alpha (Gram-positive type)
MRNSRLIKDLSFIALDLEANYSRQLGFHEIIEIGAYKLQRRTFDIVDEFSVLVRPKMKIIRAIVQKTGITDEMIRDAPSIPAIWCSFLSFVGNATLVCFHSIDISIISKNCSYYRLDEITNPYIDILRVARSLYPHRSSYSLSSFQNMLEVSVSSHRATTDAWVTALLFKKMIGDLELVHNPLTLSVLLDIQQGKNSPLQRRLF